jgi:hypothetical protein
MPMSSARRDCPLALREKSTPRYDRVACEMEEVHVRSQNILWFFVLKDDDLSASRASHKIAIKSVLYLQVLRLRQIAVAVNVSIPKCHKGRV